MCTTPLRDSIPLATSVHFVWVAKHLMLAEIGIPTFCSQNLSSQIGLTTTTPFANKDNKDSTCISLQHWMLQPSHSGTWGLQGGHQVAPRLSLVVEGIIPSQSCTTE